MASPFGKLSAMIDKPITLFSFVSLKNKFIKILSFFLFLALARRVRLENYPPCQISPAHSLFWGYAPSCLLVLRFVLHEMIILTSPGSLFV
jgi:hypothetical protein